MLTVLGNHDYLGDTLLQIGDALTQKDSRWFCQRSYELKYSLCGHSHKGISCILYIGFLLLLILSLLANAVIVH